MSGCAIVAIVGAAMAVLAIPAIGILAAIALPAYQDYVTRSKVQVGYIRAQALETEIKELRERHHVSQPVFARYLNTSESTVEKWEAGTKKPSGLALKLLTVVQKHGLQVLA